MPDLDLDRIEALARAVIALDGRMSGARVVASGKLSAALTPDVVLALVARLRAAEAACVAAGTVGPAPAEKGER